MQPEIPSYVTPGVATGIIVCGFVYWFGFAKVAPALGYHIDSEPDELVDGSRIVTYKVRLLYSALIIKERRANKMNRGTRQVLQRRCRTGLTAIFGRETKSNVLVFVRVIFSEVLPDLVRDQS